MLLSNCKSACLKQASLSDAMKLCNAQPVTGLFPVVKMLNLCVFNRLDTAPGTKVGLASYMNILLGSVLALLICRSMWCEAEYKVQGGVETNSMTRRPKLCESWMRSREMENAAQQGSTGQEPWERWWRAGLR